MFNHAPPILTILFLTVAQGSAAEASQAAAQNETNTANQSIFAAHTLPAPGPLADSPAANVASPIWLPRTNQSPLKLLDLNPALRDSFQLISTSNLLASLHDFDRISPADQRQILFNMARLNHQQKNYEQAIKNYDAILQSEAPQSMKQYAMIDLAVMAQEQDQLAKAQQILAQYVKKYPDDPGVPEVLLRQGLLYRQMGVPAMALAKFYAVMTSALTLKKGHLDYYQRLVLQAQTEIAETTYLQGQYQESTDFFLRLLKLDAPELNKPQIQFKLVRSLAAVGRHAEAIAQAEDFLVHYAGAAEEPEIRFLLVTSLKQLGRKQEALQQVLRLLRSQQATASQFPERWGYWQQRTGNEIGNQLYQEADYLNALEIYSTLASLNSSPAWQLPVWYQIGLVYERFGQPRKALEHYQHIIARQKDLAPDASPSLKTVVDMATWRNDFINWHTQAERNRQTNAQVRARSPLSAAR